MGRGALAWMKILATNYTNFLLSVRAAERRQRLRVKLFLKPCPELAEGMGGLPTRPTIHYFQRSVAKWTQDRVSF